MRLFSLLDPVPFLFILLSEFTVIFYRGLWISEIKKVNVQNFGQKKFALLKLELFFGIVKNFKFFETFKNAYRKL